MCMGGKSSTPQAQKPPPPAPPTVFDYNTSGSSDARQRAAAGVNQAQSATLLSETQPSGAGFGSDLGGVTAKQ